MAHTDRRSDDKRRHPAILASGTRVGAYTPDGISHGKVIRSDGGGWIYVDWDAKGDLHKLPGYLRATQVFTL